MHCYHDFTTEEGTASRGLVDRAFLDAFTAPLEQQAPHHHQWPSYSVLAALRRLFNR
jgi:hypothetical protein